jgi:AcrR family transcriptional regulator
MGSVATRQTRQHLMQTASRLLSEKPAGGRLSMSRLATEAGVSRATVYRYFPDKSALLAVAHGGEGASAIALDTRGHILDAALEVFAQQGIHATTLKDVAARAGLSLSGLHWYFSTKDELVAGVVEHLTILPTLAREAALAEDGDLETQLTHIGQALARELNERGRLLRLVVCEAAAYPDVQRLWAKHIVGQSLPLLAHIFDAHAQRGLLRAGPAVLRARAFVSMFVMHTLLEPMLGDHVPVIDDGRVREYVRLMLTGVLAERRP